MNFEKIIATGMVLANLAMPVCAKMYEKGMNSEVEKQYKVDLIGNFSDNEVEKIENVMKNLEDKLSRKTNRIKKLKIENVDNLGNKMREDEEKQAKKYGTEIFESDLTEYVAATINAKKNLIKIDSKAIYGKPSTLLPLAGYEDLLAHEIGHIIYEKYPGHHDIYADFSQINLKLDKKAKDSIPKGYVSAYPLSRIALMRPKEDFAETFSYWLGNKHYADKDMIVQKKIDAIRKYAGKRK